MTEVTPDAAAAVRGRFTPEEWAALQAGPLLAAAVVTASAPSGLIGLAQEGSATGEALTELTARGGSSPSPLVAALAADLRARPPEGGGRGGAPASDPAAPTEVRIEAGTREAAIGRTVERLRAAADVLARKGSPADVAAYRDLVLEVGRRVAGAAKEGGVLGLGGTRVTAQEEATLQQLAAALTPGEEPLPVAGSSGGPA